ncbi:MAG: hypothetical protein IPK53_07220 [bacterium]|nr:hypothetical protein [bacterium]
MAPTNREGVTRECLKRALLLGFVTVSVVLIGLIWADGLVADQPATPSYYRDSFQMDPSVYLTVTAEAMEFENQLKGTPALDSSEEHHGSGSGQGQGHNAETAVPTPTSEAAKAP